MYFALEKKINLQRYINANKAIKNVSKSLVAIGFAAAVITPSAMAADYQDIANMCFACHGETGKSEFKNIPNLQWQNKEYLVQQLNAFKNGTRKDKTMTKVAQLLSDQDIQQISAYFYSVKEK